MRSFLTLFVPALLLVSLASVAKAGSSLILTHEVERSPAGDRVLVRWDAVPESAVEQEVVVSFDGGRTWTEVHRPASIDEREAEIVLPPGLVGELLFGIRVGDDERELDEAVSSPISTLTAGEGATVAAVSASWRAHGGRSSGPTRGGGEWPKVLEPSHEDEHEKRLSKAGAVSSSTWLHTGLRDRRNTAGHERSTPDALASPLSYPLRN